MITFAQLGRYGRLGNGMFQIASTIGIARKFGYQFAFPEWKNYDHVDRFGSHEDIDVQKYFLNPLPFTDDPTKYPERFIHWGYHNEFIPDNVSLAGHMQSEKYFKHCEQDIRHYFRMKNESLQGDHCAIHVRLGDYDNAYHPRLDWEYYGKAMAEFPADTRFLLFSDDIRQAKEIFPAYVQIHHTSNYLSDFGIMKSCKHFIIGNSSYSWWAAWLGVHPEKKVVAPSKWFGPVAGLSPDDIYCPEWIVI